MDPTLRGTLGHISSYGPVPSAAHTKSSAQKNPFPQPETELQSLPRVAKLFLQGPNILGSASHMGSGAITSSALQAQKQLRAICKQMGVAVCQ